MSDRVQAETPSKILIVFGTRAGSTREVANFIGQVLREEGHEVDVACAEDPIAVHTYSAVIAGTAIRSGRVMPEIQRFIETHRLALWNVPVAYFAVCMTLHEDTPPHREVVDHYLDSLREIVPPFRVGLFGGKLDVSKLNGFMRLMFRAMHAPQGDWRDWEAIREWALEVHGDLNVLPRYVEPEHA